MFDSLSPLPADPILGLSAAHRSDSNPRKIDLGVGVYKDEQGHTPVMRAVKTAEARLLQNQVTKTYVSPAGSATFNSLIADLVLGDSLNKMLGDRRVTFQTPGGCGGLRLAAEFIQKVKPGSKILVSDPTWANHVPLLGEAGLQIETYPYYDYNNHGIRFDDMMTRISKAGVGDLVLLHGCCHNPCGADLNQDQWQAVAALAQKNGFTPFIDLAYQGLGDGLADDSYGVRLLAETLPELIVVSSCSKNFGLYRERTGALTVIADNANAVQAAASQIASTARGMYSMPPDHGASVVAEILADSELNSDWEQELTEVRERINSLRSALVTELNKQGIDRDFGFIEQEKGMFSFLGLSVDQVQTLINDYSIYLVNSSRINIAGINSSNIGYLAQSIAAVLKSS
ncbi:aromatic amino acid transaminase [Pseudohongiella sp.]|uniref:Aminotransferase class I/classII large domain-containing protein n=1 Tax=marine sediment metagenome TaxID=412755 RepID=A0A0F9W5B7_9ZZZZ|nr:amino acid aminotransferase [Pseudohongiella sp.]HDZ09264.1 aspartate/tyrosine/aromatic aminotransferase [Pseudohongiella sp.]HEA62128.1 aspartate/tyrosine/aromatic aminotransferase [Pseudohongiella sp.]